MSNPTGAEQALHNEMRKYGCCVTPGIKHIYPIQIHHIQGMKRKEWAVIPLHPVYHQASVGHEYSIHGYKEQFREKFGHEWTLYFKILGEVIGKLDPKHQAEIIQKIDAYAISGHASKQFMDEYERVGVEV